MILLFDIHEIKGKTSTKSVSKYLHKYVQFIRYFSDNAKYEENVWKMDTISFLPFFPLEHLDLESNHADQRVFTSDEPEPSWLQP